MITRFLIVLLMATAAIVAYAPNTFSAENTNRTDSPSRAEKEAIDKAIWVLREYDPQEPGGNFIEAEGERIYVFGLIDERPSITVQFAMEGGNSDYLYLLVLDRKSNKATRPLRIGGRGYRHITIHHIELNSIYACALFYAPNDSLPQPSVVGTVSFQLYRDEIVESSTVVNDNEAIRDCEPMP